MITNQHLGQGANQAFEDVYHLVLGLCKHHPNTSQNPTTLQLDSAFRDYEDVRLTRSASLVRQARERGQLRTSGAVDPENVKKREETFIRLFGVEGTLRMTLDYLRFPYDGENEI